MFAQVTTRLQPISKPEREDRPKTSLRVSLCCGKCFVKYGELKITTGLPQGSIGDPFVFLIYVNSVDWSIRTGKIVQYVDNSTLWMIGKNCEDLVDVNLCIQKWLNLKTNYSKSNVIWFQTGRQNSEFYPTVKLDTLFLGVHIDQTLTWGDHVDHVSAMMTSGIYALRKLVKLCLLKFSKMANFGHVYPQLQYGIRLWSASSKQIFKFETYLKI